MPTPGPRAATKIASIGEKMELTQLSHRNQRSCARGTAIPTKIAIFVLRFRTNSESEHENSDLERVRG